MFTWGDVSGLLILLHHPPNCPDGGLHGVSNLLGGALLFEKVDDNLLLTAIVETD